MIEEDERAKGGGEGGGLYSKLVITSCAIIRLVINKIRFLCDSILV